MSILNPSRESQHNDYNKEPVFYCEHCLSLNIRHVQSIEDSEYCDKCGSTNIGKASIEMWGALYKERFGHNYLDE